MKKSLAMKDRLQVVIKEYSAILILLALVLAMSILKGDSFLKSTNLVNIIRQQAVIGIIALGIMFPIVSGGTDLSGGSVVALCGVFAALAVRAELPIPLVFLIAIDVYKRQLYLCSSTFRLQDQQRYPLAACRLG